jgi:hypothetical protein
MSTTHEEHLEVLAILKTINGKVDTILVNQKAGQTMAPRPPINDRPGQNEVVEPPPPSGEYTPEEARIYLVKYKTREAYLASTDVNPALTRALDALGQWLEESHQG